MCSNMCKKHNSKVNNGALGPFIKKVLPLTILMFTFILELCLYTHVCVLLHILWLNVYFVCLYVLFVFFVLFLFHFFFIYFLNFFEKQKKNFSKTCFLSQKISHTIFLSLFFILFFTFFYFFPFFLIFFEKIHKKTRTETFSLKKPIHKKKSLKFKIFCNLHKKSHIHTHT